MTLHRYALSAALALALPSLAFGQGIPVFQSGTMVPYHVPRFDSNGLIQDASRNGVFGDSVSGLGLSPFGITDHFGPGVCSNTASTLGPYSALCLGHDGSGNGVFSLDSFGGASNAGTILFRVNGINIPTGTVNGMPATPNHASLKALAAGAYTAVLRTAYTSAGDSPATLYYWDGASACVDDGGSCVVPNAAPGTGRWRLEPTHDGIYDTRMWGCRVDGATDDTACTNAAIAWASSIGGATISLVGTSVVGCSTGITLKNLVTLAGTSKQVSRLKLCNNSPTDVLRTDGVANLVVAADSTSSVSIPATVYSGPPAPPALSGGPLSVVFILEAAPVNTFNPGAWIQAVVSNGGAGAVNWLTGTVTSYNAGTKQLVVNVLRGSGAAGPFANWHITQLINTGVNDGTAAGGPWRLSLRDITLDGNAPNNTANPNGRGFYSYAQGITLQNVDIFNTRGWCWEQHNAFGWLVAANDVDGIVRNLGGTQLIRCNQRGDPDMPGGIGGGSLFFNGPTDSRLGDMLIGWPGPPITMAQPNGTGANVKVGPSGNVKFSQAELFGGGYVGSSDVFWPKYGLISESLAGQGFVGHGTLISGGDAYQVLSRGPGGQAVMLYNSIMYVLPNVTSSTSLAVGTGSKSFTVPTGMGFKAGGFVQLREQANGGNFMSGVVTSYNVSTGVLVANIDTILGSGTYADWNVGPAFEQGGVQIGDAPNGFAEAGTVIDAYYTDINGPNLNQSWDGGFNLIKLRGVTNFNDPNNQIICSYIAPPPPATASVTPCIPGFQDEFDVAVGSNPGTTRPVRMSVPHGTQIISASSGPNLVPAATTVYLGPSGISTLGSSTALAFEVPFVGFIQYLTCQSSAAPSGSETYTYTIFQSSIARPLSGVITGASQSTGPIWIVALSGIPVAPTDAISVQLQTSAGAASAAHVCSIGYTF
jgi:hypothetical protein